MSEQNCPIPSSKPEVDEVALHPDGGIVDYQEAMAVAREVAAERLGDSMLMSWYDRDRDLNHLPIQPNAPAIASRTAISTTVSATAPPSRSISKTVVLSFSLPRWSGNPFIFLTGCPALRERVALSGVFSFPLCYIIPFHPFK